MDYIWIERVSQSIAYKIDCHHSNKDHKAREDRQPGRAEDMNLGAFKNVAPAGCRRLDSKPQIAQTRFGDDSVCHFQGRTDKQGTHTVRQDAQTDQTRVAL